jgi:RNA-directed DNA polymerase
VSSTLSALRAKAEQDPKHRFRAPSRLLDRQMLGEAFASLRHKAAPGIDGVTHAEYAENLDERLEGLEARLKAGRYRATSVKRRWIDKPGSQKKRPLGIPVLEDKIVQQAVRMILDPIWEADFVNESIGYRPGRGARESGKDLRQALHGGEYRWVVEADIRGFFDHIDHGWLVRMLEQRIADRPLIHLVEKWLKAGVLEEDGRTLHPATGTPQGGVISPLLANIYLHFVLDLWIHKVVAKHCKGRVLFRRYADDSVVCFEREEDARAYLRTLPKRLGEIRSPDGGGKEFAGQIQPVGAGRQREVHLPRLRLLLGEDPAHSTAHGGETADQPKEVPSQPAGDEGMDETGEKLEADGTAGNPEAQAEGVLELLRRHRELDDDGEVPERGAPAPVQMVKPAQPASVHDLGHVRPPAEIVGSPAAPGRGNPSRRSLAPPGKTGMIPSNPTTGKPRSACASSEEPSAAIPHAGICEGGAGRPASLPQ